MALHVAERIAAGSLDERVLVHHLVLRGSNRAIGRHLGEIARGRYGIALAPADDPDHVRARREWFRLRWPGFLERMKGVADAFGVDVEDDAYDIARIGAGGAGGGCGVVLVPPRSTVRDDPLLSRSFDAPLAAHTPAGRPLPPARPYVIEAYPDDGYASLHLCTHDFLGRAVDGVNAEGLGVALAVDDGARATGRAERARGRGAGLDELELVRFLLDTCATAADAREAVRHAMPCDASAAAQVVVVDRDGDAFSFACGAPRERVHDAAGRPIVVANDPVPAGAARAAGDGAGATSARERSLRTALAGEPGPHGPAALREIAARAFEQAPSPVRTVWHGIYDLRRRALEVSFLLREPAGAPPIRSEYLRFELAA